MLEKLIEVLVALTAAINANTAAAKSVVVAPAPVAETPAPVEEPKKTRKTKETPAEVVQMPPAIPAPTVQDVRAVATQLMDANGNDDGGLFAKINAKHGTKRISEVPEAVRAEVIAEIKAKLAEVTAAKAGASAI